MPEEYDDIYEEYPEEVEMVQSGYSGRNLVHFPNYSMSGLISTPQESFNKSVGNAQSKIGSIEDAAGKTAQVAGAAAEKGGQAAQKIGQGLQKAGEAIDKGSDLLGNALSLIPYVGQALGAGTKGIGKVVGGGTKAAGKGLELGGKAAEKGGKATKEAGKKASEKGKQNKEKGKKLAKGINNKKDNDKLKDVKKKFGVGQTKKGDSKPENVADQAKDKIKDKLKDKADKKKEEIKEKLTKSADPNVAIKNVLKIKLKKIKVYAILILILIVIIALLVGAIMGYIIDSMAVLDEEATNIANDVEKFSNFMNGMGFQNSEDAFYDELNYQNRKYDYQLDVPLIMSTLFYDDMHTNGGMGVEDINSIDELDGDNPTVGLSIAKKWVSGKIKEANVTVGPDGLEYSANKIYRLRKLAKNSFERNLFGFSSNTSTKEVYLIDYIEHNKEQFDDDTYRMLVDMFKDPLTIFSLYSKVDSLSDILSGEETWDTTTVGSILDDNYMVHRYELIKHIISSFADVESIGLCNNPTPYSNYDGSNAYSPTDADKDENGNLTDNFLKNKITSFCVKYKVPEVSEEYYFKYLKEYYIKHMPEFRKYISSTSDESRDKEIDKIIEEIKQTRDDFANIFPMKYVTSTENYSEICKGNIKKGLVDQLEKPVSATSYNFNGNDSYGASGGSVHQGVDINQTSAGVSEGADVYSVFDYGEVLESTADKTYSDKKVKGGWVKIKYTSTVDNEAYYFSIIYGGLSKSSLTLKKGDQVSKKQVIGKIGNKDESEDGNTPGLHFGFYDETAKTYLDPTNIFVPCVSYGSTYSMANYPNAEKVANAIASCAELDDRYKDTNHIAAILANLNLESVGSSIADMNPEAIEIGVGEWNGGIGISQWTSGRNTNIRAYAQSQGTTWRDLDLQIKFLLAEFNPNGGADGLASFEWLYNDWLEAFLSKTDEVAATEEYANHFERCGICHMEERKSLVNDWKSVLESSKKVSADAGPNGGSGVSGQSNAYGKTNQEKLQMVFPNGVPSSDAEAEQYLVDAKCDTLSGVKYVQVHRVIAQDVTAACEAAKAEGFNIYDIGGYRSYTGESQDSAGTIPSLGMYAGQHGYGLAVDINPTDNGQFIGGSATGAWDYNPNDPSKKNVTITENSAVYKSFTQNGWGWGGHFNSSKDYMHFSFFGT